MSFQKIAVNILNIRVLLIWYILTGITSEAFAGTAQRGSSWGMEALKDPAWCTSADRLLGVSLTLPCRSEPSVSPLLLAVHGLRVIVSQIILGFPEKDG